MNDKLKECPFCGGEGWLSEYFRNYFNFKCYYEVICKACFSKGRERKSKAGAISAWNKRQSK